MFTKIQKYLLIHHPLLWNTKIVPAVVFAVLFHITFFVIGYCNGVIDFTNENYYSDGISSGVVIFFSVLVTILFFVMWFVYYFRNNAYKSFYHLKKSYLYKEWLIILLVVFLNVTYSVSYIVGKTIRERGYYSHAETLKRCETINMASIFIVGGYEYAEPAVADSLGQIVYNKKKYSQNSLMNKSVDEIGNNPSTNTEIKVKTWMQNNEQEKIKQLMRDYFTLVNEHHLSSNLTPEKWFELTYHYPEFTTYERIGRVIPNKNSDEETAFVTANQTVYKYNVPQNALTSAYSKIFRAWDAPIIETGLFYTLLYLALSLTMLIFSFKVTTGRNWLIALITTGVLFIITGILSAITGSGIVFLIFWLLVILAVMFYFFDTVWKRKGKEISGIALNLLLWASLGFLPIIYALLMEHYNHSTNVTIGDHVKNINTPEYEWLDENMIHFTWVNILIIVVMMYFFTHYIKKWKALAES